MNGVLGHDSALYGYTGPGTTWANEMNPRPKEMMICVVIMITVYSSIAHSWASVAQW